MRATLWAAAFALLQVAAAPARAAPGGDTPRVVAGVPLAEALQALREDGLKVVFSSGVVTADLRVIATPTSSRPEEVLLEILAPHGLTVEEGLGRRLLVVPLRGLEAGAAPGAPPPVVAESITVRTTAQLLWDPATGARSLERTVETGVPHAGSTTNEALALLPGTAGEDVLAPIHLRGAHADEVAVLLDGVEIRPTSRLVGAQGIVGVVDEGVLQRVDVLAGGYPAEHGGRLGGVLSLVTASPAAPRRELGLGSHGARAYAEGPLGARAGWMVALRQGDLGALFDSGDTAYQNVDPEYLDAFGKLEHELDGRGSLRLGVFHAADRTRLVATDPEPDDESHPDVPGHEPVAPLVPARFDAEQRDRQTHAWLALDVAGSKLASRSVLARGFSTDGLETLAAPMRPANQPPRESRARLDQESRRVELRQDWTWRGAGRLSSRAGFRVVRESVALERWRQRGEETARARAEGEVREAYASEQIALGSGGSLEIGARWEWQSSTGTQWSPRLNLAWPLGGGMARVAAGRVTQVPRLSEMDLAFAEDEPGPDEESEPGEPPAAGPGEPLRAQTADQLVLGFERRFGPVSVQVEAYRYEIGRPWPRDVYLTGPLELPAVGPALTGGARSLVRVHPSSARVEGVELLTRARLSPALDASISYSLAEATDRIDGVDVPRGWDQEHSVDAYLAWRPRERWRAELGWFYHSGRPGTEARSIAYLDETGRVVHVASLGPLNGMRNPIYHRLDLGISRTFDVRAGSLEIELAIGNLYDRDNVCCVERFRSSVEPDLTVSRERFDFYWLPRTPTLAATWRF